MENLSSVSQMLGNNQPLSPLSTNNTATPQRDDTVSQIGATIGTAAGGGAASFKFSSEFSSSIKSGIEAVKTSEPGIGNKVKATLPTVKEMGITSMKGAGIGALIAGGVSAITNIYDVSTGKKTGAEAVGTAAADAASGAVGGMLGVASGGLATFALSSMLGSTPLMIVGVGVGALGAIAADKLFKGTGLYDGLRNSVIKMMSK
ncbi:MAG: hypothetical protein U0457_21730 [Candidatus Sericytochromatia bacterium]